MKFDSGSDLKQLKVDGGMTNGDLTMSILVDIGGFSVIHPEMREQVLLLLHLFIYFFNALTILLNVFFSHYFTTGRQLLVRLSVLELPSNFLAGT